MQGAPPLSRAHLTKSWAGTGASASEAQSLTAVWTGDGMESAARPGQEPLPSETSVSSIWMESLWCRYILRDAMTIIRNTMMASSRQYSQYLRAASRHEAPRYRRSVHAGSACVTGSARSPSDHGLTVDC